MANKRLDGLKEIFFSDLEHDWALDLFKTSGLDWQTGHSAEMDDTEFIEAMGQNISFEDEVDYDNLPRFMVETMCGECGSHGIYHELTDDARQILMDINEAIYLYDEIQVIRVFDLDCGEEVCYGVETLHLPDGTDIPLVD